MVLHTNTCTIIVKVYYRVSILTIGNDPLYVYAFVYNNDVHNKCM